MARTARQRAALRKAQLASARKRRGKGKGKLGKANRKLKRTRIGYGAAVVAGAAVGLGGYRLGSRHGVKHGVKKERESRSQADKVWKSMSKMERREIKAHVKWNGP